MAHRKKWYEARITKFLENGGSDGRGAATATEMIEYLRNRCGKRQLPSTGAVSHSLRGVRSAEGGRVLFYNQSERRTPPLLDSLFDAQPFASTHG